MNTLNTWLQKIESVHSSEIELGLNRIRAVASKMQLLEPAAKVVLIAGTNGKGSCAACLEALALSANKKVGCYTSPHLERFNERIRINGFEVSDDDLIQAFEAIEKARGDLRLTFFEYTSLAAFWLFSKQKLDCIILEVGLGGRLDAVNIIEPDVSIVTCIDRDHQNWLGNDLVTIAYEKSGIYRKNSYNLVGDQKSYDLILKARPQLLNLVTKVQYPASNSSQYKAIKDFAKAKHLKSQNIHLAFAAFERLFCLSQAPLKFPNISDYFHLKGRFQRLDLTPMTIVDVAHNPQSIENLAKNIASLDQSTHRYAICGFMKDKEITAMLEILKDEFDQWIFVDLAVERAATAEELLTIWQGISDRKAQAMPTPAAAFELISDNYVENTQIIVFGSFITVAAMLQYASKKR